MKIRFAIIFVLCSFQAKPQNYTLNLQKYWWYRYMLVNDFMKIGSECGESIPASGRNVIILPQYTNNSLEWGDATTRLGNYLTILATEYKLLKQNNLSVERTKYEMYYALKAFDRLDRTAEEDVVKEGIDVASMNALLLKKIEELTLYIVKQQQDIDELKKQIENR